MSEGFEGLLPTDQIARRLERYLEELAKEVVEEGPACNR